MKRRALLLLVGMLAGAALLAAPEEEAALRARIRDMASGVRDVPLPLLIEELSGHRVLPWNGEAREALIAAADCVRADIEREGLPDVRINEVGNAVEARVLAALAKAGFEAGRPVAPSGRTRAAGYPDLEARLGEARFYIEVKVFSSPTEESTQRTFYLSPSADFKVTRDAYHLLIAVELSAPDAGGRRRAISIRWLNLSRLRCDLKYEFNASNRDLYTPAAGLVILEASAR